MGLPFPIFIVAFVVLIAKLFTKKTAFGLFLESTGINPVSSRFAGINVDRIKWLVYTFCGVMAAVAGLIESAGIKGADCNNAGLLIEMDAILAVAIGGTIPERRAVLHPGEPGWRADYPEHHHVYLCDGCCPGGHARGQIADRCLYLPVPIQGV